MFSLSYDDLDDLGSVLAASNSLEASVVLRENPVNTDDNRCSFNSSDSGRASTSTETYGDPSSSSVASNSSRLCSNNSNCSGDSGACSDAAASKEQTSPNYPPFDHEVYGHSISIGGKKRGEEIYSSCRPPTESSSTHDPTYSRIDIQDSNGTFEI